MPIPESTWVSCGKPFALLPNKPSLVNTCPQCSVAPAEIEVVGRKPRKKRQKTSAEEIRDHEGKRHRLKNIRELIFGKQGGADS